MTWKPKRTIKECHDILTRPGSLLELQDEVIDGVKFRTYKNIPKSVRDEWLAVSVAHGPKDYVVYEGERYTYTESRQKVNELANLYSQTYGCKLGDRIVLLARNSPEWVFAFWAIQVLGCVAVAVNCWLPEDALTHCTIITDPKLVILDVERAQDLKNQVETIKKSGAKDILVLRSHEKGGKIPEGMKRLEEILKPWEGVKEIPEATVAPEDIATIFFTSGTTGLPKGVIGTNRQFITNAYNLFIPPLRAILRNGDDIPPPDPNAPQKASLLSTPLFHATGCHSILQVGTIMGFKIVLMYKWTPDAAIDLVLKEGITTAGGIPFMTSGLLADKRLNSETCKLENLGWGGGPVSQNLANDVVERFKNRSAPSQGYGATELAAAALGHAGEDYLARPTSTGLPTLVADVKICDEDGKELSPCDSPDGDGVGEIYVRAVNRANGYWKDEKATKAAFLPDGWFRTGDIGYQDHEGFFYILDRAKDIIIRGGENIASTVVENAIYADGRLEDVAVFPIADDILGELVGAAVTTKRDYHNKATEAELIAQVAKLLPKNFVPSIIDVRSETLPRNGNGKTVKKQIRAEVTKLWEARQKPKAKL